MGKQEQQEPPTGLTRPAFAFRVDHAVSVVVQATNHVTQRQLVLKTAPVLMTTAVLLAATAAAAAVAAVVFAVVLLSCVLMQNMVVEVAYHTYHVLSDYTRELRCNAEYASYMTCSQQYSR